MECDTLITFHSVWVAVSLRSADPIVLVLLFQLFFERINVGAHTVIRIVTIVYSLVLIVYFLVTIKLIDLLFH